LKKLGGKIRVFYLKMLLFMCLCLQAIEFTSVLSPYQNDWDEDMRFNSGFMKDRIITGIYSYHDNHHEDRRWRFSYGSAPGVYCLRKRWTGYMNGFDRPLNYKCRQNEAISGISSYHNNHHEDRRWKFQCCKIQGYSLVRERLTGYLNSWDRSLNFRCASFEVLVGLESYHDNRKEDRRWKARCATLNTEEVATGIVGQRHSTGYVNNWDQAWTWSVGHTGVLTGLRSHHDNHKEDRRFRVYYSHLNHGVRCHDRGWSGYINNWDSGMNFKCPHNQAINGFHSYHDNRREDRRWKVRCCYLHGPGRYSYISSYLTGYVNNWDGGMDYSCPSDEVLVGIWSTHDNRREDRIYRFYCGRLVVGSLTHQQFNRGSEVGRNSYFFNRRIDEIFIIMTHNSLALPFKVFSPNQNRGLGRQFRDGIRGFNFDLYPDGSKIKTCHGGSWCYNPRDQIRDLVNELNKDRYDDSFIIIQLESYIGASRYHLLERWFGDKLVKNFNRNKKLGYYMEKGQQVLIFTDRYARPNQGIHWTESFIVENGYSWKNRYGVPNMNYRRGPKSGIRMRVMSYFCCGTGDMVASRHVNNPGRAIRNIQKYKQQSFADKKINGLLVDYYSQGRVFEIQRLMRP